MSDHPSRDPAASIRDELETLAAQDAAALLVDASGQGVLWATPAGARTIGAANADAAVAAGLDRARIPVERLAELAGGVAPVGAPRLERLRIVSGRRVEMVTFACRRLVLEGGPALLLLTALGPRRPSARGEAASALPPWLVPQAAPDPSVPAAEGEPAETTVEQLRQAAGGRSLLRFVWQTDADGRFVAESPALAAVTGSRFALKAGGTWSGLVAAGLDDAGRLAEALAGTATFTNVEVLWPVGVGDQAVPVALSGVPEPVRGGGTGGFRGFGLVRIDGLCWIAPAPDVASASAAPAEAPAAPTSLSAAPAGPQPLPAEPSEPALASVPAEEAIATAQRIVDGLAESAPPQAGTAVSTPHVEVLPDEVAWKVDASEEPPLPGRPGSGAVVPFDQVKGSARGTLAGGATKVVPLRSGTVPLRPEPGPGLSRSERNAFREIARALGARIEGDEDEPPADAAEPADARPARAESVEAPAVVAAPPQANLVEPSDVDGQAEPPAIVEEAAPLVAQAEPAPAIAEEAPSSVETEPEAPALEASQPESEPDAAPEPEPEPEPEANEEPVSLLARHADLVFDRLPVGILVSRGDVPIAMNRTLLDLLGWETIDAFHAEGGLDHLFRGRSSQVLMSGDGGTVALQTREGDIIGVDARLQTLIWDDLPATMMTFRRAVDAEFSPKLKAAEMELRQREAETRELRAMLDTATDGVIVLDEAGRILSINRSGEALFGYDQREVAGETFISLFAPDSHATALDYLEGLKSNGVASVLNDGREVVGRVRQGGRIPLFMTLGAISDPPSRKFCAVLRDITPWKKAEADLLEAKRAAEEASAQKSDFLAKMSHEIRTPLSAIIGFAEVMMEERFGPVGNERYLEYLRDIHASGGHVISLVNDLLDLSKIEAGRFDLSFVSVDVNESVSRSVALIQPQAGSARVVVRTALAQRLPRVVADERSMRQIVLNLLSNAVKFTDPGGQVIVSTAMTDRGEVAIRVRDTGIGMTDKEIETALEPFRQVATARQAGGTGLGLPLTKALVEANRASLTIRSARDSGTLVEILFPTTRVLAE